jgi:transcriptional accessory protein Tex/SPT6
VKVGDVVKVWVVGVDEKKKRIALSMVKEKT